MAKLKLDLHEIYNRGGQIDAELNRIAMRCAQCAHHPQQRGFETEARLTSREAQPAGVARHLRPACPSAPVWPRVEMSPEQPPATREFISAISCTAPGANNTASQEASTRGFPSTIMRLMIGVTLLKSNLNNTFKAILI